MAIQHWQAMHSRTYLTKLLRSLGDGGIFQRGWHNDKDPETGRNRRRSTFNLNREHEFVRQVVASQWQYGDAEAPVDSANSPPGPDALASEPIETDNGFVVEVPDDQLEPESSEPETPLGKVLKLFSRT